MPIAAPGSAHSMTISLRTTATAPTKSNFPCYAPAAMQTMADVARWGYAGGKPRMRVMHPRSDLNPSSCSVDRAAASYLSDAAFAMC